MLDRRAVITRAISVCSIRWIWILNQESYIVQDPDSSQRQSLPHEHTISDTLIPPLAMVAPMYRSGLEEYILLRLSRRSLTAASDDRMMYVLVPRTREYIGL